MIEAKDIQYSYVQEPYFGVPEEMPTIPDSTYERRFKNTLEVINARGLDYMLVYADREHYGNFDYLTGFGPRFEEAILLISKTGETYTFLGNECMGLNRFSRIPGSRGILAQTLSLPNQPIEKHRELEEVFREIGVTAQCRVGLVGWKLIYPVYGTIYDSDIPSYIVESIRSIVGREQTENATDAFIHPAYGMRTINDAHEIAYFEYGAAYASDSVQQILQEVRPEMTEVEISQLATCGFLPTTMFPKVLSGSRLEIGMASPSTKPAHFGERFQVSIGLIGGLTNRKGFLAYSEEDIPEKSRDYIDKYVKPYFALVANWYEMVGIDVSCGDIYKMVDTTFPKEKYGWFLNPGHYTSTEEWMASPIYENSQICLKSGMCLQMDIIPSTSSDYAPPNCEDGIAIADAELRRELKELYPDVYERIESRRSFMREVLNIQIRPEILPLSNLTGLYRPFVLNREKALFVGK